MDYLLHIKEARILVANITKQALVEQAIAKKEIQRIKTENELLRKLLSEISSKKGRLEVTYELLNSSFQNSIQELETCRKELTKAYQKNSSLEDDLKQADTSMQEAMNELRASREECENLRRLVFNPSCIIGVKG